jgi:predicted  nucleic acid-binding Zn-ribbon protein
MGEGTHRWFMTNIRDGYLVVEGCPACGARSSFFSTEHIPPVDEYQDGEHIWIYMGSFQAVKFDLECSDCGRTVDLGDMNGLMLSTCEDSGCEVGKLVRQQGAGSWVYVALCADSSHAERECVSREGITALNEYFNQDIEASDRKVVVVPCRLCDSIDRCRGIVIADIGLTDLYSETAQERRSRARG